MSEEINDVPLDTNHEEDIREMDDPVVIEASELRSMDRKLAKVDLMEKLVEQRDGPSLDTAS